MSLWLGILSSQNVATFSRQFDIFISESLSPFINAYEWGLGFGTRYANPTQLPPSAPRGISMHPNGNFLSVGTFGATIYQWTVGVGFGTRYTSTTGIINHGQGVFNPSGDVYVFQSFSNPIISAWAWNNPGFGTKYANPATQASTPAQSSATNTVKFSFTGSNVFMSTSGSPFIHAYAWSAGFGTKYADPAVLPGFNANSGYSVTYSPVNDDVLVTGRGTPGVNAYAWSAGFGTKYTNPVGGPTRSRGCAFSASGNAIALASDYSPRIFAYPWTSGTGFGTKYADPSSPLPQSTYGVAFSPNDDTVAITNPFTSPFIHAYAWSAGFGTKYTNPAVLPGSTSRGVTFSPN